MVCADRRRVVIAGEFQGAGEYVIPVLAALDLGVGGVGNTEYFVLQPQVILVSQILVLEDEAGQIAVVVVVHMVGELVFVHERSDEAYQLQAGHVVGSIRADGVAMTSLTISINSA